MEISGAFSFYKQSLEPQVRQLGVLVLFVAVFYSLSVVVQEVDPKGSAALSIIINTPVWLICEQSAECSDEFHRLYRWQPLWVWKLPALIVIGHDGCSSMCSSQYAMPGRIQWECEDIPRLATRICYR